ncbi:MAG: hypothetical protein RL385_2698 [Pseudomonadota bacterium]|jgi:signal transduction histidine kinase
MKLRGISLRIYLVSLAQVVAVAGTLAVVRWLTHDPRMHPHFEAEALLAARLVEDAVTSTGAARRETMRIHALLGGSLSVYSTEGALLETNTSPALPPISGPTLTDVLHGRSQIQPGPPPLVSVPLTYRGKTAYLRFRPRLPPRPPQFLIIGVVVALVAGALGTVLVARSIAHPLAALSRTAQALGDGDLKARADLKRNDELGDLAVAFDTMAERLGALLRAQQELIADVSHELRTPLSRIRVALDLAEEADPALAQEALKDINEDLGELERLVSDVLQSARLDLAQGRARTALPAVRNEMVDVRALLDKSITRFRQAEPGRPFEIAIAKPLPSVVGDAMLLRRAVDNLLDNAAAYSDAGTPITLGAREKDGQLCMWVADRGIGIAAEHIPQLTRPFFRADPSRTRKTGGYGLGLSLCSRILIAHRGSMDIESKVGDGTTVTLKVPVAA